jgi:hypothetical protein
LSCLIRKWQGSGNRRPADPLTRGERCAVVVLLVVQLAWLAVILVGVVVLLVLLATAAR